jgi:multiple sugar transport system permease protein
MAIKEAARKSWLPRLSKQQWRDQRNGMLFIAPWLLGLLIFSIYPIFASLFYSFTDYSIIEAPRWIGLDNFRGLFTSDSLFRQAVLNTLYLAVFSIPIQTAFAVALAHLINAKIRGISIYRAIVFMPNVIPAVASAIIWFGVMFQPQIGLINVLLREVGLPPPGWLSNIYWAKPALILLGISYTGWDAVIYLAALQDVPQELYDAAEVDGAGLWAKTRHVTLPMISSLIFFMVIMRLIWTFQYFTEAYVMTKGGPAGATTFYAQLIYQNGIAFLKMGYASAQAWLLFAFVILTALLIFKIWGPRVFYAGVR